jgi:Helix-turn-helix domain
MMPIAERTPAALPSLALAESLTEADAAAWLGLKVATLRAWRHRSKGPAFVRLGRAVGYLSTDLDEFLRANRHAPASGPANCLIIDQA